MSFVAIFIASLLGSPHCGAMCGGFVALTSRQFGYHFGRLVTYSILGIASGFIGAAVNASGSLHGMQNLAGIFVGIILITSGLSTFLNVKRHFGSIAHRVTSFLYKKSFSCVVTQTKDVSPTLRSFAIGMMSTFLPCGWLYTFVAVAGASGSPVQGIGIMIFFWLGTLPAMVLVSSAIYLLNDKLRQILPRLSAVLTIVAGLYSLFLHEGIFQITDHHSHHLSSVETHEHQH